MNTDCDDDAASEKGEQASTDVEQADQGANISQGRSFDCPFCKRGFSNAQALGGHMNIHRKDKAKLRQSPNDVGKLAIDPADDGSNLKCPWNINASSRDQTHLVHIKQLPLFVETPYSYSCEPQQSHAHQPIHDGESTERGISSNHISSLDLDLELRLGPDPQDSSSHLLQWVPENSFESNTYKTHIIKYM